MRLPLCFNLSSVCCLWEWLSPAGSSWMVVLGNLEKQQSYYRIDFMMSDWMNKATSLHTHNSVCILVGVRSVWNLKTLAASSVFCHLRAIEPFSETWRGVGCKWQSLQHFMQLFPQILQLKKRSIRFHLEEYSIGRTGIVNGFGSLSCHILYWETRLSSWKFKFSRRA